MSEPLSVAASIIGLISISSKLIKTLHQFHGSVRDAPASTSYLLSEMKTMEILLSSLQGLVQNTPEGRKHVVMVEHLVVILTECVTTYSDLDDFVEGAKLISGNAKSLISRAKWTFRETDVEKMLQRLHNHKTSLTLMLGIMQSETLTQANRNLTALCAEVAKALQENRALAEKVRSLESNRIAESRQATTHALSAVDNQSMNAVSRKSSRKILESMSTEMLFEFDKILWKSRVYRKYAMRDSSAIDAVSLNIDQQTAKLSMLSGISLSDISNISVFCLPLFKSDIHNSDSYEFGVPQKFGSSRKPKLTINTIITADTTPISVQECEVDPLYRADRREESAKLRRRLGMIPGFNDYLEKSWAKYRSPERHLIEVFGIGTSLCYLYNLVDRHLEIIIDPKHNLVNCDALTRRTYVRQFINGVVGQLKFAPSKTCTIKDIFHEPIFDESFFDRIYWTINGLLELIEKRTELEAQHQLQVILGAPDTNFRSSKLCIIQEQLEYIEDLKELLDYKEQITYHDALPDHKIYGIFGNLEEIYTLEKALWPKWENPGDGWWKNVFERYRHIHLATFIKYVQGLYHALELAQSVGRPLLMYHRTVANHLTEFLIKPILRLQSYPELLERCAIESQATYMSLESICEYQKAKAYAQEIKSLISQARLEHNLYSALSKTGWVNWPQTGKSVAKAFDNGNLVYKHGVFTVHDFINSSNCFVSLETPYRQEYPFMHLYLSKGCLSWYRLRDTRNSSQLVPSESGIEILWRNFPETIHQICPIENSVAGQREHFIYVIEHPTPETVRSRMIEFSTRESFREWVVEFGKFCPKKMHPTSFHKMPPNLQLSVLRLGITP